jgi:hypothetical protein
MWRILFIFILLYQSPAFATKKDCRDGFSDPKPLSDTSHPTRWALNHSGFKTLKEVKDAVVTLGQRGVVASQFIGPFVRSLKHVSGRETPVSLRYKFIFNAIETVLRFTDENHMLTVVQQIELKMLAHIAVWGVTHGTDGLGQLGLRNHFSNSIGNLFTDSITRAYVRNAYDKYYEIVKP